MSDRTEIQTLLDSGVPLVRLDANRTYRLDRAGSSYWCLDVHAGTALVGADDGSTTLLMVDSTGPSVRLIHCGGSGIRLELLNLVGGTQTPGGGQRHGVFAQGCDSMSIHRVNATGFEGDGVCLNRGSEFSVTDCVLSGNLRNGLTLNGTVAGVAIVGCTMAGNGGQQIDSEPGGTDVVSGVSVIDCVLDVGTGNDYALTISGTPTTPGGSWTVSRCAIRGGTVCTWAAGVTVSDCDVSNPTTKPCLQVYRGSSGVCLVGSRLFLTQTAIASLAAVLVQGTGTGSAPSGVSIIRNRISVSDPRGFGVRAEGCIDVRIEDNDLVGSGVRQPGLSGIYLRATNAAEDFRYALVRGNSIADFGERAISVAGNGAARLLSLDVLDNSATGAVMTRAVVLDDGSHPLLACVLRQGAVSAGITPLLPATMPANLSLTVVL